MEIIKFNPCPFCGERNRFKVTKKCVEKSSIGRIPVSYVRCLRCNCRGPLITLDISGSCKPAIEAWNDRGEHESESVIFTLSQGDIDNDQNLQ